MGPIVGLLLFEHRGGLDEHLVDWVGTFGRDVERAVDGPTGFWVRDPTVLGAAARDGAEPCRFCVSVDDGPGSVDAEYAGRLGRSPVQGVVLAAGCKRGRDHRLMGHMALALARRFDALVDFNGDLGGHWLAELTDPSPQQEAARREYEALPLTSLPGRLWNVDPDDDDPGGPGAWHVGDADFLEAWLRHPRFRLVK